MSFHLVLWFRAMSDHRIHKQECTPERVLEVYQDMLKAGIPTDLLFQNPDR